MKILLLALFVCQSAFAYDVLSTNWQKRINEVNSGIMAISALRLRAWLDALDTGNEQGEYYLTDIVAMAHADEVRIRATVVDETEVIGVNNKSQLAFLERHYQSMTFLTHKLGFVNILSAPEAEGRLEMVALGEGQPQ